VHRHAAGDGQRARVWKGAHARRRARALKA
jgi:hypothetical protein